MLPVLRHSIVPTQIRMFDRVINTLQLLNLWRSPRSNSTPRSRTRARVRTISARHRPKPRRHSHRRRSISAPIPQTFRRLPPSFPPRSSSKPTKHQPAHLLNPVSRQRRSSTSSAVTETPRHNSAPATPEPALYDRSVLLYHSLQPDPNALSYIKAQLSSDNSNTLTKPARCRTATKKSTGGARLIFENDRVAFYQYVPREEQQATNEEEEREAVRACVCNACRDKTIQQQNWSTMSVFEDGCTSSSPPKPPSSYSPSTSTSITTTPLSTNAPINPDSDPDPDPDPDDLLRTIHLWALMNSLTVPGYISKLGTDMSRQDLAALFSWQSARQLRMSLGYPDPPPCSDYIDSDIESDVDIWADLDDDSEDEGVGMTGQGILKVSLGRSFADGSVEEQIDRVAGIVRGEGRGKKVRWGWQEVRYYEVEDEGEKTTGLRKKEINAEVLGDLIEFD